MSLFVRVYEHLLPRARAFFFWQDSSDPTGKSQLRQFFEGLAGLPEDVRTFFDDLWDAVIPETTDQLDPWEEQFDLPETGLSDPDRRIRLLGAWSAAGGQSPRYLQDLFQASGFNVFLHPFWDESALPARVVRDPNDFLEGGGIQIVPQCGELLAECGEPTALCGEPLGKAGYPLVNKIRTSVTTFLGCADPEMECGEALALCGEPQNIVFGEFPYAISSDPDTFPYFLYIGGEVFPELATVEGTRRDEFENLVLKYCPGQQWLGILVDYN